LHVATFVNAVNASLYSKLNFNFIRDIAPVAGIAREPFAVEVHPSVPVNTPAWRLLFAAIDLLFRAVLSGRSDTQGQAQLTSRRNLGEVRFALRKPTFDLRHEQVFCGGPPQLPKNGLVPIVVSLIHEEAPSASRPNTI